MSKYEIKEKIDSMIYGTFNMISQTLFFFSKSKSIVAENRVFKDKHFGERCFILGTGPSLKNVDLSLIENEIKFGVNYLYKSDIINEIKPKYYCLYDEVFHDKNIEDTIEILEKLPDTIFFFRTKAFKSFEKYNISRDNIFFQACNLFQYGDYIKINMMKNMTAPFNVVLGCIQTAIYMGFKDIYLLGCDFNSFASLNYEHFYDKEDTQVPNRSISLGEEIKFYTLVTYHHYALEKYAKRNNINIYNLTSKSLLDAYERKNYLDIFKD